MHFLHTHLDILQPNLGVLSGENGDMFRQDIKEIDKTYQAEPTVNRTIVRRNQNK